MADYVETMVSANSETPWHGKGAVLSGYPDLQTMYKESGLTWKVAQVPLFFKDSQGGDVEAEGVYGIVRDSDSTLLGTCSERYKLYQNSQAFDWCKPLIDSKFWKMETAGSLRNGKVCWALLNSGMGEVMKGDKLKRYLLLQWGHTGHDSIQVGLTSVRVVCNNTLQQALRQDVMNTVRHDRNVVLNLDELRQVYEKVQQEFEAQQEIFKKFLDTPIDKDTKTWYINSLVDALVAKPVIRLTDSKEVIEAKEKRHIATRQRKADFLHLYIEHGTGQEELGIQDTLWGLFNGAEEFLEKCNGGKKVVDRGWHILHGQGKEWVDAAYDLAQQLVTA